MERISKDGIKTAEIAEMKESEGVREEATVCTLIKNVPKFLSIVAELFTVLLFKIQE